MICWPRYLLWTLITLLGLGNILVACGQKGDLYLPDKPPATQESAAEDRTK